MKKRSLIIALSILALNLIIKFIFIHSSPIGGDEPFTLFYAQSDWKTIFEMLPTENNPPLHLFLMKIWVSLFGIELLSARFLSVLFSSITALIIFYIGKRFYNELAGILSALLFTFSSYVIHLSHDARPYALLMLLTGSVIFIFLEIVQNRNQKLWWILGILNSLIIYTHFVGFFILFAQLITWSFHFRDLGKMKWKVIYSWIIPAIAYLPYFPIFLQRLSESKGGNWLESPRIEGLYNMIWAFSNEPLNTVLFLNILVAGFVTFFIRKNKIETKHTFLFTAFLIIYLVMFIISQKTPMFLDRYLAHVSIAYYTLIGISVSFVFRKRWKIIVGVLLLGLMIFTVKFNNERSIPEDQIALKLKNELSPNTGVILVPNWYFRTFAYHYDRGIFKDYKNTEKLLKQSNVFPASRANNDFNRFIETNEKLILVDTGGKFLTDFPKLIESIQKTGFKQIEEDLQYEPYRITYYERD